MVNYQAQQVTLPETNIFAPENGWLEYLFPFGTDVSFRECSRADAADCFAV